MLCLQGVFVQKHPVILSPLWYIFEEAPEDLARYFPTPVVPVAAADQPTSSCDAAATAAAASTAADAAGGSAAAMGSPAPSASDPAGCSMPVSSSQCDSSHQHGAGYRNDDTQTSSGVDSATPHHLALIQSLGCDKAKTCFRGLGTACMAEQSQRASGGPVEVCLLCLCVASTLKVRMAVGPQRLCTDGPLH